MSKASVNKVLQITSGTPVTLVGGGPLGRADLDWALARTDLAIAADGGAAALLAAGRCPDAVIGDMDSIDAEAAARIPPERRHEIAEQDSTDFEKCLQRIAAPMVLGLGFLGGRTDHALAALSCLARLRPSCLLVGEESAAFAAPPEIALDLPPGSWLSLFPFAPVTGRSEGLRWPIEGIAFAPAGTIGTSNAVTGPVRLAFDGPGMVVLVPGAAREAVLAALSSSGR